MKESEHRPEPVAIIGMACIFPQAEDLQGYWHVVRAGVDGISEVPPTHWNPDEYFDTDPRRPDMTYCRRGGFLSPIVFDPTEFSMPPNILEATDTAQILGLVVSKAALDDAGYGSGRVFDRERTSVILGVTGTLELVIPLGARLGHPIWRRALLESGVDPQVAEEVVERIAEDYVPWQENSFPGLLGNVVAGRVANRLDLHGTNCVVDAACASTLSASHLAVLELQAGRADMVLTGGIDTFNDIFMYMCFSKTPALSPSGEIAPFSERSDGTLLGEGIGVVVLKRLADARRDDDRVYAVLRGVGTASDGSSQAIYAPYAAGQARALRDAYRQAAVDPRTVTLVEAHGTGTKVGDVVEFEALRQVYGEFSSDRAWCALGSVKSQIGHTKAAAGAAGLIKAALALYHKVLPPTLKVDRPNPKLQMEESPFYLNVEARPWLSSPDFPRRGALSSFGFGGSNYHVVLEEAGADRTEVGWDGSVRLLAVSSQSREALAQELVALAESPSLPRRRTVARMAAESCRKFDHRHPHRLVLVLHGEDLADPRALLQRTAEAVRQGAPAEFHGEGPAPGKLAFLFPGQGSQYPGMARDLACIFPESLQALEAVGSEVAARIFPRPVFSDEERRAQQQELTATQIAQPALGSVSLGMLKILERFGVRPEMTAGHSYGELCALHAAGCFDSESLFRLSHLRGRRMAEGDGGRGAMLAVTAPAEKVDELLDRSDLKLSVANRNSPRQTVLSGEKDEIARAEKLLAEHRMPATRLPVSAAFHSPLVASARAPFHQGLEESCFSSPSIPVYANKTAAPYPVDPGSCRELLADQLVSQVDFVGQIRAMSEAGARVFLEVGPKNVLSRLVRSILEGQPHHALALDSGKGKGLLELARALANLAALGYPVDLCAWELPPRAERKNLMEVELVGANYRAPKEKPQRAATARAANGNAARQPSAAPAASRSPAEPPSVPAPARPVREPAAGPLPVVQRPSLAPAPSAAAQENPAPSTSSCDPGLLGQAFLSVQGSLEAMQAMQRQTAEAHHRFLEGQEAAQRTFHHMVEAQQRLVESLLTGRASLPALPAAGPSRPSPALPAPAAAPRATAAEESRARVELPPRVRVELPPTPDRGTPASIERPAPVEARVTVPAASSPAPQPPAGQAESALAGSLLAIVAEKTGYPVEMLSLDMDLEADLGIDSIKRVEILAAVGEALPNLPTVQPDRMGSLRTLREVVATLGGPAPAPAPGVEKELLEVVAEKTGYPVEMLSLDMDLEADLGIDSIKRVEILAAFQERVPGMPAVEPDRMGSLRSLREVVLAVAGAAPAPGPVPAPSQAAPTLAGRLLEVVAEKTGYPVEMLNLDMDLEADLGVDSIKRVEILAAVQEQIPGLPPVESDRLGSLRTLRQIVDTMGASAAPAPSRPAVPAPSGEVESGLLRVVAEKTGYPVEMLNLDMDLEADLGIDSIKRVEILAAVQEQVPNLPAVDSDRMGSLRTLRQIVESLGADNSPPAPAAPPNVQASADLNLGNVLLQVVSEKTGYPVEMLHLEMDLEADLGIDSIKRVEILAAVQERDASLGAVDAERMGSLRTLRQVLAAVAPPPTASPPEAKLGRKVLRAVLREAGAAERIPVAAGHEVVVVDDRTGLGKVLVRGLKEQGVPARQLKGKEALEGDLPLGGLVLIAGKPDGSRMPERTEKFLKRAFLLVQEAAPALRRAAAAGGALLVTVSRMDGAFGLEGRDFDVVSGGLAGLPKTAAHEWPGVVCRALDVAPDWEAADATAAILAELCRREPLEVGLAPGARRVLAAADAPVTNGEAPLCPGDVVIVTGGARGVTAEAAVALARRSLPTLVLLGRSEPQAEPSWLQGLSSEAEIKRAILSHELQGSRAPAELERAYRQRIASREVFQTLDRIEAAGSRALYRSVDVRDPRALEEVLREIRGDAGPIRGIIHAAGVLADKRIEDKLPEQFEMVFDTKVTGLRNLLSLTEEDDLKALVLFSSVTARFGRPGQVDYCMANEVMNKVALHEAARRPGCRVVAINWGPWEGGMVTPALRKEFERLGVGLIPLLAGAECMVAELGSGSLDEVEVLIGDGFPEPAAPANNGRAQGTSASVNGRPPLTLTVSKRISREELSCLGSHIIGGRPVLPMALMLEWFGQAALQSQLGMKLRGLDHFRVYRGVTLEGTEPVQLGIYLAPPRNDGDLVEIDLELRGIASGTLHAGATALLGSTDPQRAPGRLDEALHREPYPHAPAAIYRDLLFHGPGLHAVRSVRGWSAAGMVAELAAAPRPSEWERDPLRTEWVTDPMAVDGALQLGILWCLESLGKPSLPSGGQRYRQYARFPEQGVTAALAVSEHSPHRLVADVSFFDAEGQLVARFEGLEWTADAGLRKAFAREVVA